MRRPLFSFLSSTAVVAAIAVVSAQNGAVTVTVDAAASKHAINPNVYGVAYATTAQLADLNVPINRYGGNNTSRYNWQLNADNRGQDWYFESIGDSSSTAGQRGDDFVTSTRGRPRRADDHDSDHRLHRDARLEQEQARQLLHRQVRRADRQRLAVVRRRR